MAYYCAVRVYGCALLRTQHWLWLVCRCIDLTDDWFRTCFDTARFHHSLRANVMNDDVDAPLITLLYTFTHKQLPLSAQLACFLFMHISFFHIFIPIYFTLIIRDSSRWPFPTNQRYFFFTPHTYWKKENYVDSRTLTLDCVKIKTM